VRFSPGETQIGRSAAMFTRSDWKSLVKPCSALPGLEELLPRPGSNVIGEFLGLEHFECTQELVHSRSRPTMVAPPTVKVVCNANVTSSSDEAAQNVNCNHGDIMTAKCALVRFIRRRRIRMRHRRTSSRPLAPHASALPGYATARTEEGSASGNRRNEASAFFGEMPMDIPIRLVRT